MSNLLFPIPAFTDNYIWALRCRDSNDLYVVDPGEAKPVLDYLTNNNLTLAGIVITHHHWDHIGGIDELRIHYDVPVYGPHSENIPNITHPLRGGDLLPIAGFDFTIFEIPGHTLDHIAYYGTSDQQAPLLFCGDTLFSAGCGRLFEGTPEQMHTSLQKLVELPDNTKVCCTHEYTMANLAFARHVEPNNTDIKQRYQHVEALRKNDQPSLPSTIAIEKQSNPFLHCSDISLRNNLGNHFSETPHTDIESFAALRRWKDNF